MRVCLSGILLFFFYTGAAAALDQPSGSYQKTCRNEIITGASLEAECQRKDGSVAVTMINFWHCDGPIENDDGRLTCEHRERHRLPGGSYKDTCRHVRLHRYKLEAECRTRDGRWLETSLKMKHCYGSVSNEDGHLRCH